MLKYKVYEEEDGYPSIPPSFVEKEKTLEIELVKEAVEVFTRTILFEEAEISGKRIEWYLQSIFKFELTVKELEPNSFEIYVPCGDEVKIISFKISNNPI